MPSTHVCLHVHAVFSTKDRVPFIASVWRERLHAYLGGCLKNLGCTPLKVGGVADHVHFLAGLKTTDSVADVIREVKKGSTAWVHGEIRERSFGWQDGYAAFAVCRDHIEGVEKYIADQEEHHRVRTFQEEYLEFLERNGIVYDPRYVW